MINLDPMADIEVLQQQLAQLLRAQEQLQEQLRKHQEEAAQRERAHAEELAQLRLAQAQLPAPPQEEVPAKYVSEEDNGEVSDVSSSTWKSALKLLEKVEFPKTAGQFAAWLNYLRQMEIAASANLAKDVVDDVLVHGAKLPDGSARFPQAQRLFHAHLMSVVSSGGGSTARVLGDLAQAAYASATPATALIKLLNRHFAAQSKPQADALQSFFETEASIDVYGPNVVSDLQQYGLKYKEYCAAKEATAETASALPEANIVAKLRQAILKGSDPTYILSQGAALLKDLNRVTQLDVALQQVLQWVDE